MWPIDASSCNYNLDCNALENTILIGVLLKKEKEKKKDNQYQVKKAMAFAIGLISTLNHCHLKKGNHF